MLFIVSSYTFVNYLKFWTGYWNVIRFSNVSVKRRKSITSWQYTVYKNLYQLSRLSSVSNLYFCNDSKCLLSYPTLVTYLHVAPKIWVPRDQPVSGFSLQRVWGDSGSENPEYQVELTICFNTVITLVLLIYYAVCFVSEFSRPENWNVHGTCMPCPSPRLTWFDFELTLELACTIVVHNCKWIIKLL
jgi:hypothetical protein